MMDKLIQLSATQQASLIRRREVSSAEFIQAHLQQIFKVNPRINAAVDVQAELALEHACRADEMSARGGVIGALHGVPFNIKDSIEQQGTVCTAGTWGRRGAAPYREDAIVVARLRGAGAIPSRGPIFPICCLPSKATIFCLGKPTTRTIRRGRREAAAAGKPP